MKRNGILTYLKENACIREEAAHLLYKLENIDKQSAEAIKDYLKLFADTVQQWELWYTREIIKEVIEPIRQLSAASPFLKRAQNWPRGYPGDFETIQYILEGKNKVTESGWAYQLENYFLTSPICTQHRNKVAYQSKLIAQAITYKSDVRILSIGCGTSEDLYRCLPLLINTSCEITLADVDEAALNYSLQQLEPLENKVRTIKGNIYKTVRTLKDSYDLIIIGGVFDYLQDDVIVVLLKELSERLNVDGRLFFTNIAEGNPYRVFMEYLADWTLIERSEQAIMSLIMKADMSFPFYIEKEATGLTYLVTLVNLETNSTPAG